MANVKMTANVALSVLKNMECRWVMIIVLKYCFDMYEGVAELKICSQESVRMNEF